MSCCVLSGQIKHMESSVALTAQLGNPRLARERLNDLVAMMMRAAKFTAAKERAQQLVEQTTTARAAGEVEKDDLLAAKWHLKTAQRFEAAVAELQAKQQALGEVKRERQFNLAGEFDKHARVAAGLAHLAADCNALARSLRADNNTKGAEKYAQKALQFCERMEHTVGQMAETSRRIAARISGIDAARLAAVKQRPATEEEELALQELERDLDRVDATFSERAVKCDMTLVRALGLWGRAVLDMATAGTGPTVKQMEHAAGVYQRQLGVLQRLKERGSGGDVGDKQLALLIAKARRNLAIALDRGGKSKSDVVRLSCRLLLALHVARCWPDPRDANCAGLRSRVRLADCPIDSRRGLARPAHRAGRRRQIASRADGDRFG